MEQTAPKQVSVRLSTITSGSLRINKTFRLCSVSGLWHATKTLKAGAFKASFGLLRLVRKGSKEARREGGREGAEGQRKLLQTENKSKQM